MPVVQFSNDPGQYWLCPAIRIPFLSSSPCVPWFGLALVRLLEDCSARCVVGSRVLELLWSSGW